MASSHGPAYFLRISGKVLGPFPIDHLQSLRDRGRLKGFHEVSTNRADWQPASTLHEVFGESARTIVAAEQVSGFEVSEEPPADEAMWFYEVDGKQHGPVTAERLRGLIQAGKVTAEDLVWRSGLKDWQPVESVPELLPEPGIPMSNGRRRMSGRVRPEEGSGAESGLWHILLEGLRKRITPDDLERVCRALISVGNVAVTISAISVTAYWGVLAIRADRISLGAEAILGGLTVAVLQYIGRRMSLASHNLVNASSYRLSSTAFPSSIAVVLLLSGLLGAAGIFMAFYEVDSKLSVAISSVAGLQVLAACVYAACAALHPRWLNIDCSSSVSAGEEGLGVIAVLLKVALRVIPINYGLFAIGGCFGAVTAMVLIVFNRELSSEAAALERLSLRSLGMAVGMPLVWYLIAVILSIGLDIAQSLLSLRAAPSRSKSNAEL